MLVFPLENWEPPIGCRRFHPFPMGGMKMAITMNWGALGLGSVVAFLVGWLIFGLFGAVILAIIVLVLMGILKFR